MTATTARPKLTRCPSAPCAPGAQLIGIVMPDGRVALTPDAIRVDEDFVTTARKGRSPEKRFRFSSPCIASGCQQWKNGRCGVADEVVALVETPVAEAALPTCAIRADCRWFDQIGQEACHVCQYVVTDARQTAAGLDRARLDPVRHSEVCARAKALEAEPSSRPARRCHSTPLT